MLPSARLHTTVAGAVLVCARKARSTSVSAPRPRSARPVLVRSSDIASIRASATPPPVALPVSDKWSYVGVSVLATTAAESPPPTAPALCVPERVHAYEDRPPRRSLRRSPATGLRPL